MTLMRRLRATLATLITFASIAAGCAIDVTSVAVTPASSTAAQSGQGTTALRESTDTDSATEAPLGGGVDFALERDDIDCDDDILNVVDGTEFIAAHVVVDGNLGAPCFGSPDRRLVQAWQVLASITPPGQLSDLGLFAGFDTTDDEDTTLAFVNTLDFEGSLFQMSINLEAAQADPNELQLTMAHEFSHVFTSLSTQIDRTALPDSCTTWDNGEGCFREDSLIWEWIVAFWTDEMLASLVSPEPNSVEARCYNDPSFLGPYAATNPEEDFAETFSAFVFQLEVATPRLEEKLRWFAERPGLLEFRTLAIEAGLGPLRNNFIVCG